MVTVLKTIRSSVQPCTPEDGHNGARNILSYCFINKTIVASNWSNKSFHQIIKYHVSTRVDTGGRAVSMYRYHLKHPCTFSVLYFHFSRCLAYKCDTADDRVAQFER